MHDTFFLPSLFSIHLSVFHLSLYTSFTSVHVTTIYIHFLFVLTLALYFYFLSWFDVCMVYIYACIVFGLSLEYVPSPEGKGKGREGGKCMYVCMSSGLLVSTKDYGFGDYICVCKSSGIGLA